MRPYITACVCVCPLAQVHLLDLNGNEVKRFDAHANAVNELCFDSRGEFVGSCSDDGTVVRCGSSLLAG